MGYTNLNDTRVLRAGSCDAWWRTMSPLVQQGSGAVFRRIFGLSRRPDRKPGFDDVPNFGAAVRVPGLKHGTLVNAAPLKVLGARGEPNPASSYRFEYITGDSSGRAITATGASPTRTRPTQGASVRPAPCRAMSTASSPACQVSGSGARASRSPAQPRVTQVRGFRAGVLTG